MNSRTLRIAVLLSLSIALVLQPIAAVTAGGLRACGREGASVETPPNCGCCATEAAETQGCCCGPARPAQEGSGCSDSENGGDAAANHRTAGLQPVAAGCVCATVPQPTDNSSSRESRSKERVAGGAAAGANSIWKPEYRTRLLPTPGAVPRAAHYAQRHLCIWLI